MFVTVRWLPPHVRRSGVCVLPQARAVVAAQVDRAARWCPLFRPWGLAMIATIRVVLGPRQRRIGCHPQLDTRPDLPHVAQRHPLLLLLAEDPIRHEIPNRQQHLVLVLLHEQQRAPRRAKELPLDLRRTAAVLVGSVVLVARPVVVLEELPNAVPPLAPTPVAGRLARHDAIDDT